MPVTVARYAPTNYVIPNITDPIGRHWKQPDPSKILVDDTHTIMSQYSWNTLLDYSRSEPTALYVGKMWKTVYPNGVSFLHYVDVSDIPGNVTINTRRIIIC